MWYFIIIISGTLYMKDCTESKKRLHEQKSFNFKWLIYVF